MVRAVGSFRRVRAGRVPMNATPSPWNGSRREHPMTKIVVGTRAYWIVDSILFTSHKAALEYRAGK